MSETVWIRHPETEGVAEVPKEALAMYRQSGWDLLPKKDVVAQAERDAEQAAAAEKAMRETAQAAVAAEAPPVPNETDAAARQTTQKENG